jgi:hypothetical protein
MFDEDALLGQLPLSDRLRVAAVDLIVRGAPSALVASVWEADTSDPTQARNTLAPGAGHSRPRQALNECELAAWLTPLESARVGGS